MVYYCLTISYLRKALWFPMHFVRCEQNKKQYLPLLLLADPDEKMVDKYLESGDMHLILEGDEVIGEAVVLPLSDTACELKNLAIGESYWRQGYGSAMIEHLCEYYRPHFSVMLVGTSESGMLFYQKNGFLYSHTVSGFFNDHYSEPIFENGKQVSDMLYLERKL